MKKLLLINIVLPLFLLSSCSQAATIPYSVHNVDETIKEAITESKEKIDIVSQAVSDLTFKNKNSYSSIQPKRANDTESYDLQKTDFTVRQNFGLYILNNVYHAINYGYDSEDVDKGILIHDQVQNELDENFANKLKEDSLYTDFYMQLDQFESGYHFDVDWIDNNGFRGTIYVTGDINYIDGSLANYQVNCFTDEDRGVAYCSYFDFINDKFYLLNVTNFGSGRKGLNRFVDNFNEGTLNEDNLHTFGIKSINIATGNITDNPNLLNFKGYNILKGELKASAKTICKAVLEKVSSLKFRSEKAMLSYEDATRVHFMDDALAFGLANTKLYYVTPDGYPYEWDPDVHWRPVHIVYANNQLATYTRCCANLSGEQEVFFNNVKSVLELNKITNFSSGFENDEFSLEAIENEKTYYRYNSYILTSLSYRLRDKVNNIEYKFEMDVDIFRFSE